MKGKQNCVSKDLSDGYKGREIQEFLYKSNTRQHPSSFQLNLHHNFYSKQTIKTKSYFFISKKI
jgi:hypothetical protein